MLAIWNANTTTTTPIINGKLAIIDSAVKSINIVNIIYTTVNVVYNTVNIIYTIVNIIYMIY